MGASRHRGAGTVGLPCNCRLRASPCPLLRRLSRGVMLAGAGALVAGRPHRCTRGGHRAQNHCDRPAQGTPSALVSRTSPSPPATTTRSGSTSWRPSSRPRPPIKRSRSVLRGVGFTIGHQTAWTIEASAPASVVQTLFGSLSSFGPRARGRAGLPAIPAALAAVTAAVLPTADATPLFGAHATLDGPDFRNAYSAPRRSPSEGRRRERPGDDRVAAVHAAGISIDLSDYAAQPSVNIKPDPVASGQYKQFGVAGSTPTPNTSPPTPTPELGQEVDLDQEALLSQRRTPTQRAYFDTNTSNGYVQALSQVLADVTQGQGKSGDGGDPHIVALTTSWGACEDDFSLSFRGDTQQAVETLLQSLNAAGVTIFAASGDDGVYDCGHGTSSKVAVDYPASSPSGHRRRRHEAHRARRRRGKRRDELGRGSRGPAGTPPPANPLRAPADPAAASPRSSRSRPTRPAASDSSGSRPAPATRATSAPSRTGWCPTSPSTAHPRPASRS